MKQQEDILEWFLGRIIINGVFKDMETNTKARRIKIFRFDENPDILLDLVKKSSLKDVANQYNVTYCTVTAAIKRKYPDFNNKNKYDCNWDYFEKIDTKEKAYFLGFIYADGCVHLSKNKKGDVFSIELKSVDKQILLDLQCQLKSNHKLTYRTNNQGTHCVRLNINSKKLCGDLINLGCIPRKSLVLKFPTKEQVPEYLLVDFMRGYCDGDGCLFLKDNRTAIVIVGSRLFLDEYGQNILKYLNINYKITKHKSIYKISWAGKNDVLAISEYLYKNSTIYLERKYNKYLEIQATIKKVVKYNGCSTDNCIEEHFSKGYCKHHFNKFRWQQEKLIKG